MYQEYEILILGKQLKTLLEKKSLPIMQKYDLRKVELDILSFLAYHRDGDTAKDIMLTKHISKAHISKSLDNLKQRGYIRLEEDIEDHRRVHIFLTANAEPVLQTFLEVRQECKVLLFQNISQIEKDSLHEILKKVQKNIDIELGKEI